MLRLDQIEVLVCALRHIEGVSAHLKTTAGSDCRINRSWFSRIVINRPDFRERRDLVVMALTTNLGSPLCPATPLYADAYYA